MQDITPLKINNVLITLVDNYVNLDFNFAN